MILVMIACQFLTQKLVASRTLAGHGSDSPLMRQQKVLLYVLPLVFGVGGIFFPIGVLIYWTVSNLWTLGQQFLVSREH
ncbi:MAG TPA: YidC/Oxa1 family membrane protein insertase, partial [Arthrobacter sp.]